MPRETLTAPASLPAGATSVPSRTSTSRASSCATSRFASSAEIFGTAVIRLGEQVLHGCRHGVLLWPDQRQPTLPARAGEAGRGGDRETSGASAGNRHPRADRGDPLDVAIGRLIELLAEHIGVDLVDFEPRPGIGAGLVKRLDERQRGRPSPPRPYRAIAIRPARARPAPAASSRAPPRRRAGRRRGDSRVPWRRPCKAGWR